MTAIKFKKEKGLNEDTILRILSDITKGLIHLDQNEPPLVHRDLRPKNILLGNDGNYKICSFGSCTRKQDFVISEETFEKIKFEVINFTQEEFRAPEQIALSSKYPISEKVDCWAMGVLLYRMMYFNMKFKPINKRNLSIFYPKTERYSGSLQKLLTKLLEIKPSERPTIEQISKFIEKLQKSSIEKNQNKDRNKLENMEEYKNHTSPSYNRFNDGNIFSEKFKVETQLLQEKQDGDKDMCKNTKDWVGLATENSILPPHIQSIAKLIVKAWK